MAPHIHVCVTILKIFRRGGADLQVCQVLMLLSPHTLVLVAPVLDSLMGCKKNDDSWMRMPENQAQHLLVGRMVAMCGCQEAKHSALLVRR